MKLQFLFIAVFTSTLVLPGRGESNLDLFASQSGVPTGFYRVKPETGKPLKIGTTRFLPGLDFRNNGVLYGSSSSLYTVNTMDGTASRIGELPDLLVSIAFSRDDNLYGLSNDGLTLFVIDPATGMSLSSMLLTGTINSSGSSFPGEINGIDFGPDGTLYGIGYGLYSIDPLTGIANRITPLGQQISDDHFQSLDFGPDGQFRAATINTTHDGNSNLYLIDPVTGLGQFVGSMGVVISGLASVPEPSTNALLIAGAILVFIAARRRSGYVDSRRNR